MKIVAGLFIFLGASSILASIFTNDMQRAELLILKAIAWFLGAIASDKLSKKGAGHG